MLDAPSYSRSWPRFENPQAVVYALGDGRFVLHRRERLLLANGEPVTLGSRATEVLLALVEADGALLEKGALLDRVWPGVAVEENNLQVQISALRRVLGAQGREWILTIPGRGYRFTGPVAVVNVGNPRHPCQAAPLIGPEVAGNVTPPCVAVQPFAGLGEDPICGWFAAGVTGSLITDLARTLPPGRILVAQMTNDSCNDHSGNEREVGPQQRARYRVEGSVLLACGQVRVNVQLIAADTGVHVWADRFDTPRTDVLTVQDEIVSRLVRSLSLRIGEAEARRAEPGQADENHWRELALRRHAA